AQAPGHRRRRGAQPRGDRDDLTRELPLRPERARRVRLLPAAAQHQSRVHQRAADPGARRQPPDVPPDREDQGLAGQRAGEELQPDPRPRVRDRADGVRHLQRHPAAALSAALVGATMPSTSTERRRSGAWLRILRIGTVFSPAADVVAGACLAGLPWSVDLVRAALASALVYAAGMALNDHADREEDARLHPERPLPAGEIVATAALVVGLALIATALA